MVAKSQDQRTLSCSWGRAALLAKASRKCFLANSWVFKMHLNGEVLPTSQNTWKNNCISLVTCDQADESFQVEPHILKVDVSHRFYSFHAWSPQKIGSAIWPGFRFVLRFLLRSAPDIEMGLAWHNTEQAKPSTQFLSAQRSRLNLIISTWWKGFSFKLHEKDCNFASWWRCHVHLTCNTPMPFNDGSTNFKIGI